MTTVAEGRCLTIGVHATSRGFGWVVCDGPFKLVEAGVRTALRGNKNADCLREFRRLIAKFTPTDFVLESFDRDNAMRSERIRALCLEFVREATERGLTVDGYSRGDIRQTFSAVGAETREQIAEAVAKHFPALLHRLPKRRRRWDSEDRRLAIFNAAAVVLTHFDNGATAFLNEMRNAA